LGRLRAAYFSNLKTLYIMKLLKSKSARELKDIAEAATQLANDLEKTQPTYELALANGCIDKGYNTTANGWVESYGGEAIVQMASGKKWKCVGRGCTGNAWYAYDGYIEFIPLD
jgi:hypothetical protein